MYTLFALIQRAFRRDPRFADGGVARQLMERAGARAGQSPRHARELRRAAHAWLSVVR